MNPGGGRRQRLAEQSRLAVTTCALEWHAAAIGRDDVLIGPGGLRSAREPTRQVPAARHAPLAPGCRLSREGS